jgi:outer membrane protein
MKHISLFLCLCILSISQFVFAADEVKPGTVVTPVAVEKTATVANEVKIGSVDLPQVAEKSEAGTKAMATLKGMYDKFQVTLKKKEQELDKLKAALQGKSLTAEKRDAKEKQFQKKFGEYQQFGKNAQQEFAQKQGELSKKIKDDLDKVVKDYGRNNGYAIIINKEGLVYNDSKYDVKDLTDEIIKIINGAGKK